MADATPAVAVLKSADALHNVSSIVREMRERTPEAARVVLERFNACPDDLLWYYGTVTAVCQERLLPEHRSVALALDAAVRDFEREVDRACGERDSFTGERPLFQGHRSESIVLLAPCGRRIYSFDQWRRFAPPASGDAQWKDLRSAKELARAWFSGLEPEVPKECRELFETSAATRGLRIKTIFAERQAPLDGRGRGRQHDLLAHGMVDDRRIVVAVEGKADESFGPAIGEYLAEVSAKNEARRRENRQLSAVPERINELSVRVFGRPVDALISTLRYQLLHATAGALIEAQRANVAVLVVQEFVSDGCDLARLNANCEDLAKFCETLGSPMSLAGVLAGPLALADGPEFLIGKITRTLAPGAESAASSADSH